MRSAFVFILALSADLLPAGDAPYTRLPSDPAVVKPDAKVRWNDPTPDVFLSAARGNKPLFLFITAGWIKAGVEMERVTFGDVEIATRLNEEFVPIRIDRDAFPDVDFRLQQAVAAVSGARGWPLCAFATPDGHVFAGGTFFPAEDDPLTQKPGLRSVIFQIVRAWREARDDTQKAGEALSAELSKAVSKPPLADLASQPLQSVFEGLCAEQETAAGRPVGTVVLFPAPRALLASLTLAERTHDAALRDRTLKILNSMLSGGLCDPLDGGFFRCATDGNWRVPRFEKLLVQNAEMIRVLTHAWQAGQDATLLKPLGETVQFAKRRLKVGGLYASALAGGPDDISSGDFYTWTVAEVERLIPDDSDRALFLRTFDIGEWGDFPAHAPHRNVLPNALRTLASPGDAAHLQRLQMMLGTVSAALERRPAPQRSSIVCIDSNAHFAAALIEAGECFKTYHGWADEGLALLKSLLPHANSHALGVDGKALSTALLADEAALAWACAVAFESTGEKHFEEHGVACLERIEKSFLDEKDGTFFDRSAKPALFPAVQSRMKIYADTWEPSPMGQAALAFLKWSALLDRPAYWVRAKQCVLGCGEITEGMGHYGASLALAADWLKHGGTTVTIVSKPGASEAGRLHLIAMSTFAPARTVRRAAMPENVPGIDAAKTSAYAVVEKDGKRVLTADPEELKKAIRE